MTLMTRQRVVVSAWVRDRVNPSQSNSFTSDFGGQGKCSSCCLRLGWPSTAVHPYARRLCQNPSLNHDTTEPHPPILNKPADRRYRGSERKLSVLRLARLRDIAFRLMFDGAVIPYA